MAPISADVGHVTCAEPIIEGTKAETKGKSMPRWDDEDFFQRADKKRRRDNSWESGAYRVLKPSFKPQLVCRL
jgi:hypothetical protein